MATRRVERARDQRRGGGLDAAGCLALLVYVIGAAMCGTLAVVIAAGMAVVGHLP